MYTLVSKSRFYEIFNLVSWPWNSVYSGFQAPETQHERLLGVHRLFFSETSNLTPLLDKAYMKVKSFLFRTWSPTYWGRHAIHLKHAHSIIAIYSNNWNRYQNNLGIIPVTMPIFRFIFLFLTPRSQRLIHYLVSEAHFVIDIKTLHKNSCRFCIRIFVFLINL